MKPPPDEKSGGNGAGGRESHNITSHSLFNNWWRKKHRQVRMADDFTSNHNNPAMMNVGTVNENTLGGSGARAVPQSTQEKSVVGPLMGVFEDLIKSSTPQLPPLSTSHPMGVKSGGSVRTKKTRSSDTDSSRPPKRRKGKTSTDDQRWSKRFTWPDEVSKLARFSIFPCEFTT